MSKTDSQKQTVEQSVDKPSKSAEESLVELELNTILEQIKIITPDNAQVLRELSDKARTLLGKLPQSSHLNSLVSQVDGALKDVTLKLKREEKEENKQKADKAARNSGRIREFFDKQTTEKELEEEKLETILHNNDDEIELPVISNQPNPPEKEEETVFQKILGEFPQPLVNTQKTVLIPPAIESESLKSDISLGTALREPDKHNTSPEQFARHTTALAQEAPKKDDALISELKKLQENLIDSELDNPGKSILERIKAQKEKAKQNKAEGPSR